MLQVLRSQSIVLSRLSLLSALLMVPSLAFALFSSTGSNGEAMAFAIPIGISLAFFSLTAALFGRERPQLRETKDGFLSVVLAWVQFVVLGALPFWVSGHLPTFVDGLFESVSGYTTCGASTFRSVEVLPQGILLWRAITHFAGGLGIIALSVAILPALGAGGVVLFRSEAQSSVFEDRIRPRIKETAIALLVIYSGLVLLQAALLWAFGGMTAFEGFVHACATLSTGGFSTRDASMAAFPATAQWITCVFMFLGATSFLLHGRALKGDGVAYLRSEEFRAFALLVVGAVVLMAILVHGRPVTGADGIGEIHVLDPSQRSGDWSTSIRDAAFQVLTCVTCTGFATANFDRWPDAARFLLVALMLIGGCTGSTAGGIKVSRMVVFVRTVGRELQQLLRPSRIVTVRFGQNVVPSDALISVATLVALYLGIVAIGAFLLTLMEVPLIESASGSIAAMGCVGPGLGSIGPAGNYADVGAGAKLVLCGLMLTGRLEIYAVLALFALLRRRR
ncbi:MAG: TrkH family potassium uptake protein [Planctomycetes bacterium]|nr:TrkH family potassium uptake protein [Planctomycetota bacterium]